MRQSVTHRPVELASAFLRTLAVRTRDALLPPTCLSCDRTVAADGLLCSHCWPQMRFIEKPCCAILGRPFGYDLGEGALSAEAIANPPPFDMLRSVAHYDEIARRLVQGLKFADRTDLAPWMAQFMIHAADGMLEEGSIVIPVPLHRFRMFQRRFNQSAELARAIAHKKGLEYRPGLLIRSRPTRQQVGLKAKERERNVSGAFRIPAGQSVEIKGRKIVLVDDVYTTGSTLRACTRTLRRAGAETISCLTFAQVVHGDDMGA